MVNIHVKKKKFLTHSFTENVFCHVLNKSIFALVMKNSNFFPNLSRDIDKEELWDTVDIS